MPPHALAKRKAGGSDSLGRGLRAQYNQPRHGPVLQRLMQHLEGFANLERAFFFTGFCTGFSHSLIQFFIGLEVTLSLTTKTNYLYEEKLSLWGTHEKLHHLWRARPQLANRHDSQPANSQDRKSVV